MFQHHTDISQSPEMMFNETATRNITNGSQHWQGTVPTQMPWMTEMLSFMPSKVFGCENTPSPADIINVNHSLPQTKRSSIEVDEDASAPPTKQWLSESMMLSQFGSLNLSNNSHKSHQDSPGYDADAEIEEDDCDQQDGCYERAFNQEKKPSKQTDSEDLERYVYLLFKDKKQSDLRQFSQGPNQSTLNRLARDEMDKINKAVVLWNPSVHGRPCNTTPEIEELADQDSDDNCSENNFIGKNCRIAADETGNESIIITEVFDEDEKSFTMCCHNNNYYEQQQMPIDVELVDDSMVD